MKKNFSITFNSKKTDLQDVFQELLLLAKIPMGKDGNDICSDKHLESLMYYELYDAEKLIMILNMLKRKSWSDSRAHKYFMKILSGLVAFAKQRNDNQLKVIARIIDVNNDKASIANTFSMSFYQYCGALEYFNPNDFANYHCQYLNNHDSYPDSIVAYQFTILMDNNGCALEWNYDYFNELLIMNLATDKNGNNTYGILGRILKSMPTKTIKTIKDLHDWFEQELNNGIFKAYHTYTSKKYHDCDTIRDIVCIEERGGGNANTQNKAVGFCDLIYKYPNNGMDTFIKITKVDFINYQVFFEIVSV